MLLKTAFTHSCMTHRMKRCMLGCMQRNMHCKCCMHCMRCMHCTRCKCLVFSLRKTQKPAAPQVAKELTYNFFATFSAPNFWFSRREIPEVCSASCSSANFWNLPPDFSNYFLLNIYFCFKIFHYVAVLRKIKKQ